MRDYPHLNRLISGVEHSNRLIAWAAMDFVSDFSQTPPHLGNYSLEQILDLGYTRLARTGTAIALFESAGILQTRNNLTFSDGGINVSVSDKAPLLMSWMDRLSAKYENDKQRIKIAMNIQQLFGTAGAYSEYYLLNGFYTAFF